MATFSNFIIAALSLVYILRNFNLKENKKKINICYYIIYFINTSISIVLYSKK